MNNNPVSRFFAALGSVLSRLVGRISWSSPPWVQELGQRARRKPAQFVGTLVSALILVAALAYAYQWYKNRPVPELITARITAPEITPVGDELIPEPVIFDFGVNRDGGLQSQSVAPLKLIGKEVTEGITLSPEIPGLWKWENDHRLIFTPNQDWPAGQTYQVTLDKTAVADSSRMDTLTYRFATQPFNVKISQLKFYQDPVKPNVRQIVATVRFNYPVDTSSFENNTRLILEAIKKDKLDLAAQQYQFTVTYGKHNRVAYLRSETLQLPEISRYLVLSIGPGVKSASQSSETEAAVSRNVLLPDMGSYFKVVKVDATIVRNNNDQPEQVLNLETSVGVNEAELSKYLHVYLLPEDYPATRTQGEIKNYQWQNPGEVTANILALATPLNKTTIPAAHHFATLHSYQFTVNEPRYLYVKLNKGIKSFGDFVLSSDYAAIIKVPEFPREIGFLHKGALLALNSERKLSVTVRGLSAVKFEIARVMPDNINQLVTQTQGDFNNPYFINQSFNQQNISQLFSEIRQFDNSDLSRQQYTALDLGKYVNTEINSQGPQGLFLLKATGWDMSNNTPLDVKNSRLILMTDLGLIVKDNSDKSHDVFVQSITGGTPVVNAMVAVLGKNGLPVLTRFTDAQGRANFPPLNDFIEDREPVAYLASFGSDVSFIPYNNPGRQLNYSRYDVGGVYNADEKNRLSAFLFTDRGIYRPGDEAHIGVIVKQTFAKPQPAGLPLQATVTDPRGTTVLDKKFTLDASGYMSFDVATNATSPTGPYYVNLYIVKDNQADSYLGSVNFRVSEFQPDRMRITSQWSQPRSEGWMSPADLSAKVGLWNLYGAPAAERTVSAKILLTPQRVAFDKYPDYVFADPLLDPDKPAKVFTDNLPETKTDADGMAVFNLDLERFDKATYQLTFFAEGFEAQGGRSVATQLTALVSPLSYLIGYKPDGDLKYIKQNTARQVQFIAIDPQLKPMAVNDLKLNLYSLRPVSTLVKKPDGTYQYQSIIQSTLVNSQPLAIAEQGIQYPLPTNQIGDFSVRVMDKNNTELSQFTFSVVGESQIPLAKNAELTVKLSKEEYNADEDIELQITAPYTGAGLITIERDKVYATQWFKTETTSSVQTIHIPADFEGNGYVNVAFVRDWNSPEIFISPLSYSVIPFKVSHDNHAVKIALNTPQLAKPGETFTIEYQTDKPGKIIVYAVDEGILQVANYEVPDPLSFFFQKRALEVLTQQTVDQILPKFVQERELSTVGGDGGEEFLANHLNPFKRKTDLPVVYWSGIMDADQTPRQVQYQVPDYFSGTLRVMAVAVAEDAVGGASKESQVRGHFVINPNVPTFVAPGDEFEVTASIANNIKDSGDAAAIDVALTATPGLEIMGDAKTTLTIAEGKEKTVSYKLRAKSVLGSASVTFVTSAGDKSSKMEATLSIRPPTAFLTSVKSGSTTSGAKSLTLDRNLYPEYRHVEAAMSSSPLILITGLERYLNDYPYGCTEQLTSKALPLLAMGKQPWFNSSAASITDRLTTTFQMLGQRQMTSGGFSYWPGMTASDSDRFVSVYAMHFITEAKAQGYNIPNELYYAGMAFLKELAAQNPRNLEDARLQAYAIYLLTRNEVVTTNYLTNLQLYLEKEQAKVWREDILGAYIAASYQLLKSEDEAQQLIGRYKAPVDASSTDFYSKSIANAQYLYLVASHFPERLGKMTDQYVIPLVSAMNNGEINTLLAGYSSLALGAYAQAVEADGSGSFSMTETLADNTSKALPASNPVFQKALLEREVKEITFNNPGKQSIFYQLIQAGFDQQAPTEALKQGIEIDREYRNLDGDVIDAIALGKEMEVHIQVRALDDRYLNNVAIVDLLPGGFEVVRDSVNAKYLDYADVREDRVIFFTGLGSEATEIVYRIKAINNGEYIVPPVYAQAMYQPNVQAYSAAGKLSVTAEE
ncbi:alpha-2-macroglobulin [Legionella taurinensis]|uniref:Alpha-2-macroglobulin n=1 Tax=Legionella taurinensis TaxID=70611 RepID=A0ABX5JR52_9GAMM|nr:alpha-2-macroglobulin [Legionella taurinensis]MDX1836360.1 alpha-2-macroglobulin [Legionella taurinensis]PUT41892.1 alpha-2-macroglobulin [Legionella taurinensis]PUT44681.1 alpha-2-macroglobulin [Legionella taurinensis]PUT48001.1 alpha-2-macroglobulin [Legionella taurinensis]PUT48814.1 alpha-2-macroglobulin [Legionella taurinensis]